MIESVNTVTDLLKSNTALRDNIEALNQTIEGKEIEIFNVSEISHLKLRIDNENIYEKIEVLENIIKGNRKDFEG